MKTISGENLVVKHVIADPYIMEYDVISDGKLRLHLVDVVMETKNGKHKLTYYYVRALE